MSLIENTDIESFLNERRTVLNVDNNRLNISQQIKQNDCKPARPGVRVNHAPLDASHPGEEKENLVLNKPDDELVPPSASNAPPGEAERQNVHLLTKRDLRYVDFSKEPAINNLFRLDASNSAAMLRYGDYSPSSLHLRVPSQPHLALGEYEPHTRRHLLRQQLLGEHKQHLNQSNLSKARPTTAHKLVQTDLQNINYDLIQCSARAGHVEHNTADGGGRFGPPSPHTLTTIESCVMHNNRSPVLHRLDQRIAAAHHVGGGSSSLLKAAADMDKPTRGILTNRNQTPRERLLSDLKHSYLPSGGNLCNGYNSYNERSEQMERERIKREIYQNELRLQIEEKRRLATMREEQERKEQELENKRLEQQLLRMQEEQLRDEQRRNRRELIRRNSDDFATRKQEMQSRFRKHADSESAGLRSATTSKLSSHYSPPVTRRTLAVGSASAATLPCYTSYGGASPSSAAAASSSRYNPSRYDTYVRKNMLNRMDSISNYVPPFEAASYASPTYGSASSSGGGAAYSSRSANLTSFNRYDSLSRIDALKQQDALSTRLDSLALTGDSFSRIQRRHSATQQDLTLMGGSRRSPKLQRRSSSGRFDDASMPIPLLKAHSPVARELRYSQAVTSVGAGAASRYSSSEALRKLDDRWQIPTVQTKCATRADGQQTSSDSHNIIAQLAAIRVRLQREQMRMEDTLNERHRKPPDAATAPRTLATPSKAVN